MSRYQLEENLLFASKFVDMEINNCNTCLASDKLSGEDIWTTVVSYWGESLNTIVKQKLANGQLYTWLSYTYFLLEYFIWPLFMSFFYTLNVIIHKISIHYTSFINERSVTVRNPVFSNDAIHYSPDHFNHLNSCCFDSVIQL